MLPERPCCVEGLAFAELDGLDEVVCMEPESTSSLALNTTAWAVLKLCDGRHNVEEICRIICETTGGEASRVRADVMAILDRFVEHGFVADG